MSHNLLKCLYAHYRTKEFKQLSISEQARKIFQLKFSFVVANFVHKCIRVCARMKFFQINSNHICCVYLYLSLTHHVLFIWRQTIIYIYGLFSLLKIDYNCVSQCTFISINQRLNHFFCLLT